MGKVCIHLSCLTSFPCYGQFFVSITSVAFTRIFRRERVVIFAGDTAYLVRSQKVKNARVIILIQNRGRKNNCPLWSVNEANPKKL